MSDPTIIEHQEKIGVGIVNMAGTEQMYSDIRTLSADWYYDWAPDLPTDNVVGWYVGPKATTVSDGTGHALRLTGSDGWAIQTIKVSAGTNTTISFDANALSGSGGVVVEYLDAAGKVLAKSFGQIGAGVSHYAMQATIPTGAVDARIVAYSATNGDLTIDNLALTAGSASEVVNGNFELPSTSNAPDGFVPMIWSGAQMGKLPSVASAHPGGPLLTFNEPDNAAQANMSVAQALSYWPTLMNSGMRLGSPAVTVGNTLGANSWLGKFMSAADANGYRVDFIAVHYYSTDTSVATFQKFLNDVHEAYGRPVWVTEWALADWNNPNHFTAQQQATFFTNATQMMDDLPFVERQAWFSAYEGADSYYLNSGLMASLGSLSTVGQAFQTLAETQPAATAIAPAPTSGAADGPTATQPADSAPAPDVYHAPVATDGDDTLVGSAVAEEISALNGNDVMEGGGGADHIDGGLGVDTASYEHSAAGVQVDLTGLVQIGGDATGDVLTGIENIRGSEFDDVLKGDAGSNLLSGLGGDDRFVFSGGNDTMDGGAGNDTADFSGSASVCANLETGVAISSKSGGNATLISVENLTGTENADTLVGNAYVNVLIGGAGNDTLDGHAGADRVEGGSGNDTYYVDDLGDMTVEDANGGKIDTVMASISGYHLSANVENLTLLGTGNLDGYGNDLYNSLSGNEGSNLLSGLGGADKLFGNGGDDTLLGGDGSDVFSGGSGTDNLYGDAGNDQLNGDAGADKLWGGSGDDVLVGGTGQDWMNGGAGRDVFKFALADSTVSAPDVIDDFTPGVDRIDVSAIDASSKLANDQAFSFVGERALSHVAGELRYGHGVDPYGHDYTVVEGDVDGDGVADFSVHLVNFTGTLTSSNFLL